MILNDEQTWPAEVLTYLEHNKALFQDWEDGARAERESEWDSRVRAARFDQAIYATRPVLGRFSLHGYHCTRLTEQEIDQIARRGMQLPNRDLLCERIEAALRAGLLKPHEAEVLKVNNASTEPSRANMIWFCCFPPHRAGRGGIESFFRFWGGEALYRYHDRDPIMGPYYSVSARRA